MKNLLIAAMLSVLLSACTSMPLKTMYKLARTDMMNLDPALLRVAVRMPESIRPRPDSAKLSLSVTPPGGSPKPEIFILQIVNLPAERAPLHNEQRQGDKLWVYRLNPQDISRLKQFQNYAKALKAKTRGKAKGEMSVSVNEACRQGETPASGKLLVSNWLKLDEESGYLVMAADYNLAGLFKDKPLADFLPAC